MNHMVRLAIRVLMRSALALGVCLVVMCDVLADDVAISDQTFDCILTWPKIRNTYIKNQDPQSLQKAMQIFRDSVANAEYPVGTVLQLIPYEAMVKHSRESFPKTDGWEFFALDVSGATTKIRDRGADVVNVAQRLPCFSCHSPAAKYDFVCEKGHGCAPIPFNDQQIADAQAADPRCAKK
jgi:cytochrome P460